MDDGVLKDAVRDFWDQASCGETYAAGASERDYYESHARARYELEPYIPEFAGFVQGAGKQVLEIGVGMGADHVEWARHEPARLVGVDLTPRAIEHTRQRLALYGLKSELGVADAERLPFEDETFDLVYSWGVLHHSPLTAVAVGEVFRVLRPGGTARVMIYHRYSLIGYMLWVRYGLLTGRPWRSLVDIYHHHLESPGTKAYTVAEARTMFDNFAAVDARSQLSFGDLLQGAVGQRHRGMLLSVARKLWPRALIKVLFKRHGLLLLIEATR